MSSLKHNKNKEETGNQSEADPLGSLYADHEIEDELVVGPVEIRKPVLTIKIQAAKKAPEPPTNSHACKICLTENIKHYTCSECNMCFFSVLAIVAHLRKHKRPPAICHVCNKTFEYVYVLRKHMIRHSKKRRFKCHVCQKAYKHISSLSIHKCVEPRGKPYSCEHCSKSFTAKGQLQVHTRLHTGEKPYACDICSKRFTQQTTLNNHVLKHKGIMPHRCKYCKERFRQISNLKTHIETKHSDEKVKSHQTKKGSRISLVFYSCKNCQVVLSGSDRIKKHKEMCN